jgi:hypothetical protein
MNTEDRAETRNLTVRLKPKNVSTIIAALIWTIPVVIVVVGVTFLLI